MMHFNTGKVYTHLQTITKKKSLETVSLSLLFIVNSKNSQKFRENILVHHYAKIVLSTHFGHFKIDDFISPTKLDDGINTNAYVYEFFLK